MFLLLPTTVSCLQFKKWSAIPLELEANSHYMGYAFTHYLKHIVKHLNNQMGKSWGPYPVFIQPLLTETNSQDRVNSERGPQAFTHSYKQWTQHKLWFPAGTGRKAAANASSHFASRGIIWEEIYFLPKRTYPIQDIAPFTAGTATRNLDEEQLIHEMMKRTGNGGEKPQ